MAIKYASRNRRIHLAQRLEELAQQKAEQEAEVEQEDEIYEGGYEDHMVESRQSAQSGPHGRSRNVGRTNELKDTRDNMETQDEGDGEELDDKDGAIEEDDDGNTSFTVKFSFSSVPSGKLKAD